jgi:hypothetical protein
VFPDAPPSWADFGERAWLIAVPMLVFTPYTTRNPGKSFESGFPI